MWIQGSLPKLLLAENFSSINREETHQAIEILSDRLNVPVGRARVTRIDFAKIIEVNQHPQAYYSNLGKSTHLERLRQSHSIYWRNKSRELVAYDKIAWAKEKREIVPLQWQDKNCFRFEVRYKREIAKRFGRKAIRADDLYDEELYSFLTSSWRKEFDAIEKLHCANPASIEVMQPKDYFDLLAVRQLRNQGVDNAYEELDDIPFTKPLQRQRAKNKIKDLLARAQKGGQPDLIHELDRKLIPLTA